MFCYSAARYWFVSLPNAPSAPSHVYHVPFIHCSLSIVSSCLEFPCMHDAGPGSFSIEHANLVYTRSDGVGNIIDGRGQAQCGIDEVQGRSLHTTSTWSMTPSCSSSPMVPKFAVGRGHENASEQVKIKTIPHIEFLETVNIADIESVSCSTRCECKYEPS